MKELVFRSEKGNPVTTISNEGLIEFMRTEYPAIGENIFVCHGGLGSYITDGVIVVPVIDVLDKLIRHSYKGFIPDAIIMIDEILPPGNGFLHHAILTSLFHWDINRKKERVPSNKQKTYIIKDKSSGLYKIGKSADPSSRMISLYNGNPNLSMVLSIDRNVETELHRKYSHKNSVGEWYNLTDDDLIDINETYKSK